MYLKLLTKINKLLKIFIYIIIFLSPIYSALRADSSYPLSWNTTEEFPGGNLSASKSKSITDSNCLFCFCKPEWYGASEDLSIWRGLGKKNVKRISPENGIINSATIVNDFLVIINKINKKYKVNLFDNNLELIDSRELQLIETNNLLITNSRIEQLDSNNLILLQNGSMFNVKIQNNKLIVNKIIDEVSDFIVTEDNEFCFISIKSSNAVVGFGSVSGNPAAVAIIPVYDKIRLSYCGKQIAVQTSIRQYSENLVQFLDKKNGFNYSFSIESGINLTLIDSEKDNKKIIYVINEKNRNYLIVREIGNKSSVSNYSERLPLAQEFSEPLALKKCNHNYYIIFRNGIISLDKELKLISADFISIGEKFVEIPDIQMIGNNLILSSFNYSIILKSSTNNFWLINKYFITTGKFILPIILLIIVLIFFQLYRHQKRLLKLLFDIPSTGALIILDKKGRLTRINDEGKRMLGIHGNIPFNRIFSYYCSEEHTKTISKLAESSLITRESIKQKIKIPMESDVREWYCLIEPVKNITGRFRGIVFNGIDITEQLERKRLSNWAQLAHDMQTNLSTIRLNADLIECNESQSNTERKRKILYQVNLLINRVRDIVTVARTDIANKSIHSAKTICSEVLSEFDELMFPNITFNDNSSDISIWCDKPKIIRALRNVVENGIKSIKGNAGTITISSSSDTRFSYIAVKDSGEGMDESTKSKMLKPYFTTSEKHGGSGIGTMIMQQVVEFHNGRIDIESTKGTGSEITFVLPKFKQSR
ncbi:MAG: HAMP domain-containing sensor histidine kinase [Candidatus Kapabacteria bacterium]|nr:HAMP domain-containing sensor histidine kinase [Candidatus Kapabacteria bacterium]